MLRLSGSNEFGERRGEGCGRGETGLVRRSDGGLRWCGGGRGAPVEVQDALEGRAEVQWDVVRCREWERLWLIALVRRGELDARRELDDPPLGNDEELLDLGPAQLFALRLGAEARTRVGVGGREGGVDLASDVELRLEEAGRLSREVVQRLWGLLKEVQGRESCVR